MTTPIDIRQLRGQYTVIGGTWGVIGEVLDFDPPTPMPPLPRNNGRAKRLRHNLRWLKRQQREVSG